MPPRKVCVITASGSRVCGRPVSRASGSALPDAHLSTPERLAKYAAKRDLRDNREERAFWWIGVHKYDLGIAHSENWGTEPAADEFTRAYRRYMREGRQSTSPSGGVPSAWKTARPGTPYTCKSKQVGRRTRDNALVTACVTPIPPTAKQRKRGKNTLKEGAFSLVTKGGDRVLKTQSQVRELTRKPRGKTVFPSDEQRQPGWGSFLKTQAEQPGHIPSAPGLPFPARVGSSVCLPTSPVWDDLDESVRERASMLLDELGREPTTAELAAALEGDGAFEKAARTERTCLRAWDALDRAKTPKTRGASREAAQRRVDARNQGIDTTSAEYRDLSAKAQRGKKRALRQHKSGG